MHDAVRRPAEGALAGQAFVQGHAQGVHVGPRVGGHAPGLLGAEVGRRAGDHAIAGQARRLAFQESQPEVPDLRPARAVEKYVRRLHVAVDQARGVRRRQPGGHLGHDLGRAVGSTRPRSRTSSARVGPARYSIAK